MLALQLWNGGCGKKRIIGYCVNLKLVATRCNRAAARGGREVLDQAVMFYCDYLDWEDRNIVDDDTSKFH